jgi:preprotein translocase subunit SecD
MTQPQYPPLFPQQPPPKRSRGPLLLVGGLVLLLIAIVVTGVVLVAKRSDDKPAAAPAARTKPSDPTAVEFRRVLTAEPGACPTPAPAGTACDDLGTRYTLGKVELDGSNVSEVKAAAEPNGSGSWFIALALDSKGAKLFEQLTADLAKQTAPANQVAIVVRGKVAAAPAVQAAIAGGKIQITGDYDRAGAEELAAKITG